MRSKHTKGETKTSANGKLQSDLCSCHVNVHVGIVLPLPMPHRDKQCCREDRRTLVSVRTRIRKSVFRILPHTSCQCRSFKDANMYPWSIQSLGSFLGINLSKLLTSLVQSIIKCSEFPCSQNLRVHVSKGACSHGQKLPAPTLPTPPRSLQAPSRHRRSAAADYLCMVCCTLYHVMSYYVILLLIIIMQCCNILCYMI